VFNLAVAQPPELRRLSVAGCRLLARQFRARAEAHHDRALDQIGCSRVCLFDLNVLLPVPPEISPATGVGTRPWGPRTKRSSLHVSERDKAWLAAD
jgi:hypothetical protein